MAAAIAEIEAKVSERIRELLRGEVVDTMAQELATTFASEIVKRLGPARAAEVGEIVLAQRALAELQHQMSLPTTEYPDEPGSVYIAKKLARQYGASWWEFWKR